MRRSKLHFNVKIEYDPKTYTRLIISRHFHQSPVCGFFYYHMCPMMIIYFQSFLQRSISFSFNVWVYISIRYNETWVYNAWQNTINVCTRRKTVFVVAIWEYKYLAIQDVKTQESEILKTHHVAVHFWKVLVSINYEMHDTVNKVDLHLTTIYQMILYYYA